MLIFIFKKHKLNGICVASLYPVQTLSMKNYNVSTLVLFFVLLGLTASGQKSFTGKVFNANTKLPIASASVFLSNTSIGTTTDEKGVFLFRVPTGKFELVVSCLGYETYTQSLQSNELPPTALNIYLKPKANELKEVIVQSYDKDGWRKWGKLFTDNFIGTSSSAKECKIEN